MTVDEIETGLKNMKLFENVTCSKDTALDQVDTLESFKSWGFSIVAIVGTLGNLMLCFALVADRKTRKVSYVLICHLALVDLLVCAIILPINVTRGYDQFLEFCDVYLALTGIFPGISIYFQCYVSVNRYCLTAKPMQFYQRWFSYRITQITMVLIVAVNIATTMAGFVLAPPTLNKTFDCGCLEVRENKQQCIYIILSTSSVLAFLVGMCFYFKLLRYVRSSELTGVSVKETQISRILAALFVAYFVSMILSPVVLFIAKGYAIGEWVMAFTHLLVCINYAVNPIVYGLSLFKETYIRALSRCFSSTKIEPLF